MQTVQGHCSVRDVPELRDFQTHSFAFKVSPLVLLEIFGERLQESVMHNFSQMGKQLCFYLFLPPSTGKT